MTREELFEIIDANDGELVFEDGYAMTDWSGGGFCLYLPDQQFGEGKTCGFEEALEFYKNHVERKDNTMGGRGSGGAGGGGAVSAKEQAREALNSLDKNSSIGERTRAINQALSAGEKSEIVAAAKDYPKGTVVTTFGFGGSSESYTKTGAAGKDGWRNVRTFEKTDSASVLLYRDTTSISASKRR